MKAFWYPFWSDIREFTFLKQTVASLIDKMKKRKENKDGWSFKTTKYLYFLLSHPDGFPNYHEKCQYNQVVTQCWSWKTQHICRAIGQVTPSTTFVPDDMDLTTQECKDTLRISDPCKWWNKVQLTFSLCFSSSILALFPRSFLLPLLCPTILLWSLCSLPRRKYLQNWLLDCREATTKNFAVYVHNKKKTSQNLHAALAVYSLVTRKHLPLLFHPKKKKKTNKEDLVDIWRVW